MEGTLIGSHSRIGNSLNDNIHVPADAYSEEWDQLADGQIVGRAARPLIGIRVSGDTNVVESVTDGGPAFDAGIKVGDAIIKINDAEIEDKDDMSRAFRRVKPDDTLKIVVQRKKEDSKVRLDYVRLVG